MSETKVTKVTVTREVFSFMIANNNNIIDIVDREVKDMILFLNNFIGLCMQKAIKNCVGDNTFNMFRINMLANTPFFYVVGEYTNGDAAFLREKKKEFDKKWGIENV